jgi:hypothetical protein
VGDNSPYGSGVKMGARGWGCALGESALPRGRIDDVVRPSGGWLG